MTKDKDREEAEEVRKRNKENKEKQNGKGRKREILETEEIRSKTGIHSSFIHSFISYHSFFL